MIMLLPVHIGIALTGIVVAALLYVAPSSVKFKLTYVLTGLTIGSGTWLIIDHPSHMVQSCLMGLAFLGFTFTCVALARNKMAAARQESTKR